MKRSFSIWPSVHLFCAKDAKGRADEITGPFNSYRSETWWYLHSPILLCCNHVQSWVIAVWLQLLLQLWFPGTERWAGLLGAAALQVQQTLQDAVAGWWEQPCETHARAAAEQNKRHGGAVSPVCRRKSSLPLWAVSKDLQTDLQPLQGMTTFLRSFPQNISDLAECTI